MFAYMSERARERKEELVCTSAIVFKKYCQMVFAWGETLVIYVLLLIAQ